MQTLDVISVNLWQIIISLANHVIIFLIIKKFLFKPVKNVLAKRQGEIDKQYEKAAMAEKSAEENKDAWEKKMQSAKNEAEEIIKDATSAAENRGDKIIAEASQKAEAIVRRAEKEAELEYKKSEEKIKQEIVGVSAAIAEKILDREIKEEDHRDFVESFIESIGE